MNANLVLGDLSFRSRLLLGTGKFADADTMVRAVAASRTEIVTVAIRRCHPGREEDDLLGPISRLEGVTLMPNTSGARDATEAIRAARLGRELTGSRLVKVEIHPNPLHLLPDPIETFEACRILAREGFLVMPYIPADPVLAKRLEEEGCVSVMPLGSAIGSGRGLQSRDMLRRIVGESRVPVIVDAGLRSPSEAAEAMELGCDGVLVNSAVAAAEDPVRMASAFARGVEAGLEARDAGLMATTEEASASSPLTGFLSEEE